MSAAPLRIVFAGTPDFAASSLQALIESRYKPVAVYCQPDRRAGRGRKLRIGPVKHVALINNIDVFQPLNFKHQDDIDTLADLKPDVLIVVAYGLILPQAVLDTPTYGAINVHASLLPRWRGAAPIQRAILAGDAETGITTMQMDKGLDTGDMLLSKSCPILVSDTSATLHDRLAQLGAETLLDTLDALTKNQLVDKKQEDSLACYAKKIKVDEAALDWSLSATELALQVRAFNPVPIAYCFYQGERYKVWRAEAVVSDNVHDVARICAINKHGIDVQTGDGVLRIQTIQAPGKRALDVRDYFNGNAAITMGESFDSHDAISVIT
ncbi:MAG: methionyl-tRNA formyltransferase [Gammaproteobacteria bacterium]|nr:methionyl-tRNA formyltransferase [Gammaproteobacteria bacterium]PCH62579.1 MAG: methionyl-tRNA formyltransferase [Gammaproteobacteria bacterium]PCH64530.1 MAG: methionyl-tRNA formyltransferase [Gammaproteobacteria bacterium]